MDITDILNIWGIYQRSQQHLPLTPSERAWLKMMKGLIRAALIALALALVQFFAAHQNLSGIDWQKELLAFAVVAIHAFIDARAKWASAQHPAEVKAGQMLGSVARGFGSAPAPTPLSSSQSGSKGAA